MHISACLILSLLTAVYARNLDQKLPYRHVRKDVPFANATTTIATNITSTSTVVTATLSTSILTTITLSLSTTQLTSPGPSDISTSTTSLQGFPLPPTYPNSTTTEATCAGFVTYSGSVPPTVFLTVTEGFDVTVTATNVSVTASETLITPLPACESTIVPFFGTPEGASFSITGTKGAPSRTSGNQPDLVTGGGDDTSTQPGQSVPLAYSSAAYTSTVVVTKKTPITVVAPPTTSPGPIFQKTDSSAVNGAGNTAPPPATSAGGGGGGGANNNNNPSGGQNSQPSNAPGGNNPTSASKGGNANPSVFNNPNSATSTSISRSSTSLGLGDIIASIIFSGFSRPTTTTARSTTINGVPIVILPSTVVIGDQSIAIPNSVPTSIEVDGVDFELRPSAIIAPTATITLAPVQQDQMMTITPRPTSTTVTAGDGLTFVVGQTVAVISGTTYRVGQGASTTTITVDGTAISIGPNGVGLPRTTVAPLAATASGYVVYTADGITFSVDDNEAVVSSTTYRIGANAPQMTTVIGGETVSFGPGGIGLHSTTIVPTTIPASSGSRSTAAASASATGQGGTANAASRRLRIPFSELLGWYLMAAYLFHHLIS